MTILTVVLCTGAVCNALVLKHVLAQGDKEPTVAKTEPIRPTAYQYVLAEPIFAGAVHDGDTLTAKIDLGFDTIRRVQVRLDGLDTPEVTGQYKAAGFIARERVVRWFQDQERTPGIRVILQSRSLDKYGRVLGVFVAMRVGAGGDMTPVETLNKVLVTEGLAKAYEGENKAGLWSPAELQKIIERGAKP